MTERLVLLNPGPVNMSPGVRRALAAEDVCHRERSFADLTLDVLGRLESVYADGADAYAAVLLTGSGTTAVEAMVASLVPRDGRVAVLANGVYGERMASMLRAHGKAVETVASEWLEPMAVDRLRAALVADPSLTQVAVVHNETTSGRLNELAPVAALCRELGRELLVDAVSSFGGEELDLDGWRPAGLAATANKCLHGAPGISFVLARRELLARCAGNAPALVLDLARYADQHASGFSPFTQATHVLHALRQALVELEDAGGWPARRARYRELSSRIRAGLGDLGIGTILPAAESSSMITSYRLPEGLTYEALHDGLLERGFVIYAGQGDLSSMLFRIANMGEITDDDVDRLLTAFGEVAS